MNGPGQDVSARRASRGWVWLTGSIVVVLVLAVAFWLLFLPNWRPPVGEGEYYGIDVSAHQDEVDWDLVVDDGIEFAYIKASEGQGWVDTWFDVNWTEAGRAGLDRGAYHFFTLCAPGEAQARNFLSVAPPDPDALPPAVDLEFPGNCSARPLRADVEADLAAFIEIVEEAWDPEVILYVDHRWEERYPVQERLDLELWQLRFLIRPDIDWYVWQIHGQAYVDGVDGRVDLNIMRLTG